MNLTLHLTKLCQLNCSYCYEQGQGGTCLRMDANTVRATVDLAFSEPLHRMHGFSFFGGEPLLEVERIKEAVDYAKWRGREQGKSVSFRITTNGLLLNAAFLDWATEHQLKIALSHDGVLQDKNRQDKMGQGTEERLNAIVPQLLDRQPNAVAMLTIPANDAESLCDAVGQLHDLGFRRILIAPDARANANWTDESVAVFAEQLRKLLPLLTADPSFAILNLEEKLKAGVYGVPCASCNLGVRQPSVDTDGGLYPCNQFLGLAAYKMGTVFTGIDRAKQRELFQSASQPIASCRSCALASRCKHSCACLNFQQNGDMHIVSPQQCALEQAFICAADALGKALYERYGAAYLSKRYF